MTPSKLEKMRDAMVVLGIIFLFVGISGYVWGAMSNDGPKSDWSLVDTDGDGLTDDVVYITTYPDNTLQKIGAMVVIASICAIVVGIVIPLSDWYDR